MNVHVDDGRARFSRILVPLDGSELAERALPYAARLARAMYSPLLLVQVIPATVRAIALPGASLAADDTYDEMVEREEYHAHDYLRRAAEALRLEHVEVETRAPRGDPAATLVDLERRDDIDLVVMATHGRKGQARFALGGVADPVVRAGCAPVLLVRPYRAEVRHPRLDRALVPLDRSDLDALVLGMVDRLAGSVLRHVTLVHAVSPQARAGEDEGALGYLEEAAAHVTGRLAGRRCRVGTEVFHGEPVQQVVARASHDCDLVIMATHGRMGLDRWAYGSHADRMLHGVSAPLLLVRPATAL
jgi:nucleotide-binding universal stress UspA family protein